MSDAKARHMMRYDDKEYTKEPAPSFRAWDDTCYGCAFHKDVDGCKSSYDKNDPETAYSVRGRNYIFKEVNND